MYTGVCTNLHTAGHCRQHVDVMGLWRSALWSVLLLQAFLHVSCTDRDLLARAQQASRVGIMRVASGAELSAAMQQSVPHIEITEHLNLQGLRQLPGDLPTLFTAESGIMSIRVRSHRSCEEGARGAYTCSMSAWAACLAQSNMRACAQAALLCPPFC